MASQEDSNSLGPLIIDENEEVEEENEEVEEEEPEVEEEEPEEESEEFIPSSESITASNKNKQQPPNPKEATVMKVMGQPVS